MAMNKIRLDAHGTVNNAADAECGQQISAHRRPLPHGGRSPVCPRLPAMRVRQWWPAVVRPGSRLRRAAISLHSRWLRRPQGALH